eukprot:TRINITY_DN8004_c0_g1_i3.p1 TRINITY_DN8004_c0_g1~~TRINITY_DN8004_c0_g1_i3.p1  ORF type:complete len:377 (-),score=95.34 TRINITY_DN8004_c0_g1_i3:174-1304(-)
MVNHPGSVSAVGAWGMNVVSSVGIIMINKQLMSGYDFKFPTTLTGMHFAVTGLVGAISSAIGYIGGKSTLPWWELAWFSVIANLSIVGMNLSLMLNSVGFYQISKLTIIPTVCFFETWLNGKTYSPGVKLSVVVVVLGVGVCTVTDINVNGGGFIAAAVAVVSTALQQIFIGSLQKKYSVGSFDLLSQTAPTQAASLLLLGPAVDYVLTRRNLLRFTTTVMSAYFILLSCGFAVFCNLSQYLCIGKFSATSFQVLGHMKTVLVLLLGWVLFDSVLTLKNVAGMTLAVLGMVMYSVSVERGRERRGAPILISPKDSITVLKSPMSGDVAEEIEKLLKVEQEQQQQQPLQLQGPVDVQEQQQPPQQQAGVALRVDGTR